MTSQQEHAEHHEQRPSPRLASLVDAVVGYRLTGFPAGVHIGMPSSTVTLVIPFDDGLTLSDPGRPVPHRFDSVLAGLATGPTRIHHDGNQHGIQLALRPGAVRALFGVRAAELAEGSFELQDVMGAGVADLRDQLHETDSWSRRFDLVERSLLARLREPRAPAPELAEAWRLIGASQGAAPIRDVAQVVGWSMRRLQQQFRAELGVTPKAAARVRRFERSVALVSSGRMPLTDVALRCGWSDHAHMNRDWRALAGTSPTRWRADDALAAQ
ncbi:MAG: helix-turn-helix transcriptional regulator [Humibacillus sp.]|nr:helix-turn-helix transcriptional regulator [Humibacillus sp.]